MSKYNSGSLATMTATTCNWTSKVGKCHGSNDGDAHGTHMTVSMSGLLRTTKAISDTCHASYDADSYREAPWAGVDAAIRSPPFPCKSAEKKMWRLLPSEAVKGWLWLCCGATACRLLAP